MTIPYSNSMRCRPDSGCIGAAVPRRSSSTGVVDSSCVWALPIGASQHPHSPVEHNGDNGVPGTLATHTSIGLGYVVTSLTYALWCFKRGHAIVDTCRTTSLLLFSVTRDVFHLPLCRLATRIRWGISETIAKRFSCSYHWYTMQVGLLFHGTFW